MRGSSSSSSGGSRGGHLSIAEECARLATRPAAAAAAAGGEGGGGEGRPPGGRGDELPAGGGHLSVAAMLRARLTGKAPPAPPPEADGACLAFPCWWIVALVWQGSVLSLQTPAGWHLEALAAHPTCFHTVARTFAAILQVVLRRRASDTR